MMSTYRALVLEHLKKYGTISPLEALDKFGCFRLADVIFTLRGEGHIISTITHTSNKSGKNKRYAVYQLFYQLNPNSGQRTFIFEGVPNAARS